MTIGFFLYDVFDIVHFKLKIFLIYKTRINRIVSQTINKRHFCFVFVRRRKTIKAQYWNSDFYCLQNYTKLRVVAYWKARKFKIYKSTLSHYNSAFKNRAYMRGKRVKFIKISKLDNFNGSLFGFFSSSSSAEGLLELN